MKNAYSIKTQISQFFDYRQFLKSVEAELRAREEFSHRKFNRDCGLSSPNYVQLVIQGKRNLSETTAKSIARTVGLSKTDTRLFLKIVSMNNESDTEKRYALFQDLLKDPAFFRRHELSSAQLNYYSKWYNIPVREILQANPKITSEEIASCLIPKVSRNEIEEALFLMEKLELIKQTSSGWKVLHKQLASGNEIFSQALVYFHMSMIDLGKESLKRFSGKEREISAITMQLTDEQFEQLRERIRDFKKEILSNETADLDARVFQFNFQLFPVSQKIKGNS